MWSDSILGLSVARERSCPRCGGSFVEREGRRGLLMRAVCALSGLRPYRCFDCDALFLAPKRPMSGKRPEQTPNERQPRARAAHG